MESRITTRRSAAGELSIRLDDAPHPELTERFREVEATRTPSHRRNFVRRALRFVNARLSQGRDPMSLFEDGPSAFRAALARWHRNESGRFAWDWDGERLTVFWGGKVDLDVTELLNLVLASKMLSGRRKYVDFLVSYVNHQVHADECRHDFITESVEDVRYRVMDWIRRELELSIDHRNGSFDSSVKVLSKRGDAPINTRALGIAGVRQMYGAAKDLMRLRSGPNPLDFDGWSEMSGPEKALYCKRKWPKLGAMPKFAGAQFEIENRRWYPPIPHDPLRAGAIMIKAVEEYPEYFPPTLKHFLA